MQKAKYLARYTEWENGYKHNVLEYEYKGYKYTVTDYGFNAAETLRQQHEYEQATIDKIIDDKKKPVTGGEFNENEIFKILGWD